MTPSAMADKSMADAQNSIRLFQHRFGKAPYGRLAITQQPEPLFGQSWPSLVYLPVTAFLDATQRYLLLDQISRGLADFIQEVTPHEVAHQWWGHMVGWASFHDQWLSEGFAEFSAGLFIEATKPSAAEQFWRRLHDEITQKNEFGNAPNDAGPLWLGLLLSTSKNPGAYNRLVYPKGAYILQMLRMLMRDDKTGDQDFMAMMQDYIASFENRNHSSEDFKSVVEKHMKPALDLEGNRRVDWFFRDWVYGAELPKYRLDYSFKPGDSGKVTFQGKIAQSGVSPDFRMRVPIYFDFDGRWIRAGTVGLAGNATTPEIAIALPKRPKRVSLNANHDVLAADVVTKEN
jgi:aminopeptidase N